MVLVAGSTGYVGGETCRLLVEQGYGVRALVRTTSEPAKVAALSELGAEVVHGDLRDPASLARACAGASAVISTASATGAAQPDDTVLTVDGDGQLALVDAAAAAGVEHFVYVSFTGNIEVDSPFRTAKRAVEQHLRESGMRYTILRPSAFMEAWLSPHLGFDVPNGQVTIYGSGGAPISYISFADVARFCVESLRNEAAQDTTLELGGPDAVTPLQAVRLAETVTGRTLTVQHVPEVALRAQYAAATDPLQKSFAALMLGLAGGDSIDMRRVLRDFPLQLRTVREFMAQMYGTAAQPADATVAVHATSE
jgi:uncharacterized protein YbjT (DUF2867 family)